MTLDIVHDAARGRIETRVEGQHATLDYDRRGAVMIVTHVIVPPPIEGRGIAAALTKFALDEARARGLRVVPQCPYAAHYMSRHPEYEGLRA